MIDNVAMAQELGYLRVPPDTLVDIRKTDRLPPSRVAIIATGSQGEPQAALARMATGTHRQLEIRHDDTIILSSQTIPGNEEPVNRIINQLIERGADVLYDPIAAVHVSGHGSQEDQKLLIRLLQPRFFMPIHGEPRHQHHHAQLAHQIGIPRERILTAKNGDVIELDEESGRVVEHVDQETIFVDGSIVGDVGPAVLRDRDFLARDGFVVAILNLEATTKAVQNVQIISRGFVYMRESEEFIQRVCAEGLRAAQESSPVLRTVTERVQRALETFLLQETGRRPMVITVVADANIGKELDG
jgi:ribonuclease J